MSKDLINNTDQLNITAANEFEISNPQKVDMDIIAGSKDNYNNPETGKYKNEDFDRNEKNKKIINDDKNNTSKKDAKWQEDKMNEANNQQGDKLNIDIKTDEKNNIVKEDKDKRPKDTETKIAEAKEAREDSILYKPKTETYETKQPEDTGSQLKKENYSRTEEEKKRDELNRKNLGNNGNKSEHTY